MNLKYTTNVIRFFLPLIIGLLAGQTIVCLTTHSIPSPHVGAVYAAHYDRRDDAYALTSGFGEQFGTQSVVLTFVLEITNGTAHTIHKSINIDDMQTPIYWTNGNSGEGFGPASNFKKFSPEHYILLPRQ